MADGYFEAVVFRAAPAGEDFACSVTERLPAASTRAAAWERLFEALRYDRALVGGDVKEIH
jgi:hypothetical protein